MSLKKQSPFQNGSTGHSKEQSQQCKPQPSRADSESCSRIWHWGLIVYSVGLQKAWFLDTHSGSTLQLSLHRDIYVARSSAPCTLTIHSLLDRCDSCILHAIIPTQCGQCHVLPAPGVSGFTGPQQLNAEKCSPSLLFGAGHP